MALPGGRVVLNLTGTDNMKHVEPGDFVIHLRSFQGGIEQSTRAGKVSPAYTVITPRFALVPAFARWQLKSRWFIRELASLVDQLRDGQSVNFGTFSKVRLPLPPMTVQEQIADFLDRETAEIDTLVAKQEALIATLRERRTATIAAAFEHLDRSSRVADMAAANLFDGDWVESADQDHLGEVRLLQLADVGDGRFLDRSDRRLNWDAFRRLRCTLLNPGDVLIARMPEPIGRSCVLPPGLGNVNTVVDVAVLRPDPDEVDPRYAMYALNEAHARSLMEQQLTGATRQRISRKRLGRIPVAIPPLDEQGRIADHLDAETAKVDTLIAKAEEFIEVAKERRSALIAAAVTGQLEIGEAA